MSNQLTFQNVALSVIERNNRIFISASDLARALQYKCARSVTNLFNANADEFSADMSEVIESVTSGNYTKSVRIFSLRGCHLIAMFARTPVAKEFRRWVLDILDREANPQPEPEQTAIVDISAGEVHSLVWLLLSHRNMNTLLGDLTEPLRAIGSNLAPMVHSQHQEYKWLINACNPLLKRLIEPFKETNRMEYERIKHRLELEPAALPRR